MERRQQQQPGEEEEQRCTATLSVQTVYNDNELVPSYPGIMFDFVGLAEEMEVLTLEFDARLDEITDYAVEVFVTEGDYTRVLNDESQWTRLARTEATIAPSGHGLVIPQSDFEPIKLKRGQRRTFYISMNGPWLDTIAQALDKTGEIQMKEEDFALYVGVGLNERFPSEFDKTVDPQFSGVIHYRKEVDCKEAMMSTFLDLHFLVAESEDPIFVSRLNKALQEIVQDKVLRSKPFSNMVDRYKLRQSQAPQITKRRYENNKCPDEWEKPCPRNVLGPRLFFEHTPDLQQGELKYEIYRLAGALTNLIKMHLDTREVLYVGSVPVISDYKLTLNGVPAGKPLTDSNRLFLETTSTYFLSEVTRTQDGSIEVMDTIIETHETSPINGIRRRLRGLADQSTLTLTGSIMGAQASYLPVENFPIVLREAVEDNSQQFVEAIRSGATVVSQEGDAITAFDYFRNVHSIRASFNPDLVTAGEFEEPSSSRMTLFLVIGLVILFLAAIAKVGWGWYQRLQNKKLAIKRTEMIEQKRIDKERRSIRREKRREESENIPTEIHIDSDDEEFKGCLGINDEPRRRGIRGAVSTDTSPSRSDSSLRGSRRTHSDADIPQTQSFASLSNDGAGSTPELPRRKAHRSASCNEGGRTPSAHSQACATYSDVPIRETRRSASYDEKTRNSLPHSHQVRRGRRPISGEDTDELPQLPKRQASLDSSTKGTMRTVGNVNGVRVKSMRGAPLTRSASQRSSRAQCVRTPSRTGSGDTFAKVQRTPSRTESGDTFARRRDTKEDRAPRHVERYRSVSVARTASSDRMQTSSSAISSRNNSPNDDSLSSLDSSGSFIVGPTPPKRRSPTCESPGDFRRSGNEPPSSPRRRPSGPDSSDEISRSARGTSPRRRPSSGLRSSNRRSNSSSRVERLPSSPRRTSSRKDSSSGESSSTPLKTSQRDESFRRPPSPRRSSRGQSLRADPTNLSESCPSFEGNPRITTSTKF